MNRYQEFLRPTGLNVGRLQIALLIAVSILIMRAAPEVWNYSPDSGVYVASAIALLEEGRYWFNGQPNLLYYPGTSLLLTLPIGVFGLDWPIIQLFFASFGVAAVWLTRAVFPPERFGWIGLFAPVLVGTNVLLIQGSMQPLSDVIFLDFVLLAMYAWQRYSETKSARWYWACLAIVAIAPLVRFQGLFLIAAFGIGLIWIAVREGSSRLPVNLKYLFISVISFLPFVLWTFRNYILYTPDTYNMANAMFFGLKGLVASEGWGVPDWIDADWKYPVYQLIFLFGGLAGTITGPLGGDGAALAALAVVGLMLLGIPQWLRAADVFATIFLVVSVAFLVNQFVGGRSVYVVNRYWLPVVPLMIVLFGMAFRQVLSFPLLPHLRMLVFLIGATGLLVITGLGLARLVEHGNDGMQSKLDERYAAAVSAGRYVDENTPKGTVLISNEWGVTPVLTNRSSLVMVRSTCPRKTFERIERKGATYLVILPGVQMTPLAVEMVSEFPSVFQSVYQYGDVREGIGSAVYSIDVSKLEQATADLKCGKASE